MYNLQQIPYDFFIHAGLAFFFPPARLILAA
jgi:hypothetical protein